MKFIHTSDWHLGAKLGEYSRLDEQRDVLDEICITADKEKADFIIIAGDLFDTFNPSNEAVELLYRGLKKLSADSSRPVIAIAGNHDSPDRIEAPDPLAAECGIFFIGYPDFTRSDIQFENGIKIAFPEKGILTIDKPDSPQVRILTTPYANETRLRKFLGNENREETLSNLLSDRWKKLADKYCDKTGINILTAHLFMAADSTPILDEKNSQPDLFAEEKTTTQKPEEPEEEKSILHPGGLELIDAALVPQQIQYTALGHLHRPQSIKESNAPTIYSGSPLAFGLSEENQQKSVVLVEIKPEQKASYERINLNSGKRVLRKKFKSIDEAVIWLNDNQNCYIELLIECEDYISAEDRKRLSDAHNGITAIIPVVSGEEASDSSKERNSAPDLTGSMEDLFVSYFKHKKGITPDTEMLKLFKEIVSLPEEGGEK
ncbi:MAG: exonuclease SbcCD subunit D [Spirochaetales bacterium]|nr:exonuclease SbcCD subunit D [Spirochaetales bacterium]